MEGGLPWKIHESGGLFCNLHFPHKVPTVDEAPLSGDYAVDFGLHPQVPQHNPLKKVPYPILNSCPPLTNKHSPSFSGLKTQSQW
jgi:hypothetical protein